VPSYGGILNAFRQIHREEGVRGFFKGFYMSLLSQALASSFFFWIYEQRKQKYHQQYSPMTAVALASLEAGVIATLFTQPFWVIKTRMLLNVQPNISEAANFWAKTKEIHAQHGAKGFLKGMGVNLVLACLGISQMYIYEGSRMLYDKISVPQSAWSEKNFVCGGVSKVLSGLLMYPLTTVRTRLQQNQFVSEGEGEKYRGAREVVVRAWREEGVRGFYKGLGPNILKGIPQKGLYFYAYELIKEGLGVRPAE
jgi:solute carrier family 25 folate transporter 32